MAVQHTYALNLVVESPESDPAQVPSDTLRSAITAASAAPDERLRALLRPVGSSVHPRGRLASFEVADVSTDWLTDEDRDLLEEGAGTLTIMDYEYGWFVWCGGREPAERSADMRSSGYSEQFIALMERANAEGFKYLNIDVEGTEYPDEAGEGESDEASQSPTPAAEDD